MVHQIARGEPIAATAMATVLEIIGIATQNGGRLDSSTFAGMRIVLLDCRFKMKNRGDPCINWPPQLPKSGLHVPALLAYLV